MQRGPHLVDRKGQTKPATLREHIRAEFATLHHRLNEAEKRILASLDAGSTDAA